MKAVKMVEHLVLRTVDYSADVMVDLMVPRLDFWKAVSMVDWKVLQMVGDWVDLKVACWVWYSAE